MQTNTAFTKLKTLLGKIPPQSRNKMLNLILIQTDTDSNRDSVFELKQKWQKRKISFVRKNSAFRKLKPFRWKIRPESRKRKRGDAESKFLSNYHISTWRKWVWTTQETEKSEKFNSWTWIQLSQNQNLYHQKFISREEENKQQMKNWILFQTVTNSDREPVPQQHKKLKNKENLMSADELPFHQIQNFSYEKFSFCQSWIRLHESNFSYF